MSTLSRNCNSDVIEKKAQDVTRLKKEETDKSTIGPEQMHKRMLTGYGRIWKSCGRSADTPFAEMQVLYHEIAQRS